MDYDETKDELKDRLTEYVNMITKPDRKAGKNKYICPLCGSGSHGSRDSDGAFTISDDGKTWHCFACGESGDVFDLIGKVEGINNFKDQKQRAADLFNVELKTGRPERPGSHENDTSGKMYQKEEKSLKTQNTASQGHIKNYSEYYNRCSGHLDDEPAQRYLQGRGLRKGVELFFNVGYDPDARRIIIPCSNNFYIARSIDPDEKKRYNNPAGVPIELFNSSELYEAGSPVFVTEGVFDALAVREAGGRAIALNSTSNYRKLLDELKEKKTPNTLIICLDNDEPGKKAAAELANGLRELNIHYVFGDIAGDCKDPGEAIVKNEGVFLDAVQQAQRRTGQPDNVADYIRQAMAGEVEGLRKDAHRKTGFRNLDEVCGSLYSGLYIIGGISSVGKTSFAGQLADQLAEAGSHVLYFSMEQSRLEMVSKAISRRTAILAGRHGQSSQKIRTGEGDSITKKAAAEYLEAIGDRESVIECNLGYTVPLIEEYSRDYMNATNARPVIIVDYLQVMDAATDPETGRKPTDPRVIVNDNITALKRLSRSMETPVIVLSSLNRSNYLAPLDFESFKESGSIEYTADVVWGLQLTAIHEELFTKDKDVIKKRDRMNEAKEAMPREVELICLKNRYGKSRYSCTFTYWPDRDYFKPKDEDRADEDGFKPATDEQENIFDQMGLNAE